MRCLIADEIHPVFFSLLESSGLLLDYLPELSQAEFEQHLQNASILVIRSRFYLSRDVLRSAVKLRMIARAGAGLDGIDVDAAKELGITVLHAAEGNADAVAEHVLAMMLGLLARVPEADRALRTGSWDRERFRGRELKDRSVGLIGYGNMGPAVARRLQGFGCRRIMAYDKYREDWPDSNAERVGLEEIRRHADVLSLHVPLTEETRGMVNMAFLQQCRPDLLLINTSRGGILDLTGLEQMLDSGHLSGLAMDVFPEEPLFKKNIAYHPSVAGLLNRDNVLSTPHVAGWTLESYRKIAEVLANKILFEIRPPAKESRV
jgi:D-3-phosphoglycerate dehydrogenase